MFAEADAAARRICEVIPYSSAFGKLQVTR
jgi:hypothetical protein